MALNASKVRSSGGTTAAPLEAAAYPGRIVHIVDLGLQAQRPFQGKEKPPAQEIRLVYELSDVFYEDENGVEQEDKPRWVSEDFPLNNLRSDRARSTQRYLALDPTQKFGGDWCELIGSPCVITVVQNPGKGQNAGKVYNNVAGISAMRPKDAAKAPDLVNPPVVFDLDAPDKDVFDKFPDFLQEKIKGNLEYNGSPLQSLLDGKAVSKPVEGAPVDDEGDVDDWGDEA